MSRSLGTTIADSLQLSLSYADRLLTDVTDGQFARFAVVAGQSVVSNHPAFVLGHLSLYGSRIVSDLGGDTSQIDPPANFQDVFSKDATCQDDPDGTIYPPMDEIVAVFKTGYQAALEELRKTPDAEFQRPNPNEGRIAELFPTLGSMHNFYCGGHLMMHLGQMSAWRRMQGLKPA